MRTFAISAALLVSALSSYLTSSRIQQISEDDRKKIQVLHDLLLSVQQERIRWVYKVVDRDVSGWSGDRVQRFLNSTAGTKGFELVAADKLRRGNLTRFIFKAKEKGSPSP